MANEAIRKLFQLDLPLMEGAKKGEVFECEYATLPEGCGNTVRCSGCVIRTTVTETFQTGQSQEKVPACLKRTPGNLGEKEKIDLLISTEKVRGFVLLRVDEMEPQ
jgi:hypothetical protein